MPLAIRSLPIVEHWDCHSCARCCRGSVIPLTDEDLAKLEAQGWEEHAEFRHTRIVVRRGLMSRRKVLAKRTDGSCVFLTDNGRCRIHEDHGLEAKPLVCQLYPVQLVPRGNATYLTLRRSCPSAAASRGRKFDENRPDIRRLLRLQKERLTAAEAPPLVGRTRLAWPDVERILGAIGRLMNDSHYPLARRLVHALLFCDALEQCDLRRLDARRQGELLALLEESVFEGASPLFAQRAAPSRSTAGLFRQSVFHFLRLHPGVELGETWRDRARLAGAALRFLQGRGAVPCLGRSAKAPSFEDLEKPLGPLEVRVAEPLNLFLETAASSGRYALLRPAGWSVLSGFRGLALTYAAAMWLMRLESHGSEPTRNKMVEIVVALDRGEGFDPLTDSRHRRRVGGLSGPGDLAALVAWYAQ